MAYFSSSLNVNRPLLLSLLIMKIKAGAAAFFKKQALWDGGESYGDRHFLTFTRRSLMSAAAPCAENACVGQESVTVHALLRRIMR